MWALLSSRELLRQFRRVLHASVWFYSLKMVYRFQFYCSHTCRFSDKARSDVETANYHRVLMHRIMVIHLNIFVLSMAWFPIKKKKHNKVNWRPMEGVAGLEEKNDTKASSCRFRTRFNTQSCVIAASALPTTVSVASKIWPSRVNKSSHVFLYKNKFKKSISLLFESISTFPITVHVVDCQRNISRLQWARVHC